MKKTFIILTAAMAACLFSTEVSAQDVNAVAQNALDAMDSAPVAESPAPKPKYWSSSLKTQINIGQTGLVNWAAGGDNTFSLQGFVDGNANWAKGGMFWNNRLQLDLGLLYSSSKPLLQTSNDRIYLESKWGYKTEKMKDFYFSANFDFKSQFAKGWDYKTPAVPEDYKGQYGAGVDELPLIDKLPYKDQVNLWKDARVLKSNFLAPAYTNLALGIDYTPAKWFAMNFAPVTGGFVIVTNPILRQKYGMDTRKEYTDLAAPTEEQQAALTSGDAYRAFRFEFGAQLKIDIKVNVNDNFAYSTQLVFFENYIKDHKKYPCPRINWDNRLDWKIAKYFSFTLTTNLIYDDMVMIDSENCPKHKVADSHARVQFKESLAFGFTYTIASKNN